MKIVRFTDKRATQEFQAHESSFQYGILENETIKLIEGSPFENFKVTDKTVQAKDVSLLAPVTPSKIIAVGLNYKDHIKELKLKTPEEPILFMKPNSALNHPYSPIVLPAMSSQVEFEGELALVIKKKAKHVSVESARDYILGYCCFNDVTARDIQRKETHFTRAKSFDTFACLGPVIETELDPTNAQIQTRLNGELKQNSSTSNMRFDVYTIIAFITQIMTLFPGDVITTGSPSGVAPMKKGDVVEVSIEGIGTLTNPVA